MPLSLMTMMMMMTLTMTNCYKATLLLYVMMMMVVVVAVAVVAVVLTVVVDQLVQHHLDHPYMLCPNSVLMFAINCLHCYCNDFSLLLWLLVCLKERRLVHGTHS